MQMKTQLKKGLAIGIMILFICTSKVPSIPATQIHGKNLSQNEVNQNLEMTKNKMNPVSTNLSWEWVNAGGGPAEDYGKSICVDSRGNSYLIGYFEETASFGPFNLTSQGGSDVVIAKLDAYGYWQWAISAGGSNYENGAGICRDSNGDIYITGWFRGTAYFGSTTLTSVGEDDVFVAKLDSNGDWQWAVRGGGIMYDGAYKISVDSQSNIYLTGYFYNISVFGSYQIISNGEFDIFVAKLDPDGNWLWAASGGGIQSDMGNDICVDSTGSAIITGYFQGTAWFGSTTLTGESKAFVAKLDTNGTWQWAVAGTGTSTDVGNGICVDVNGNIYTTGSFEGSIEFGPSSLICEGASDVFVTKLDTAGEWQWAVRGGGNYDGCPPLNDAGNDICIDILGNMYITGVFASTALFGTIPLTSYGDEDIFIAKLDSNGNWLAAISAGGPSGILYWGDKGTGISVAFLDQIYLIGIFNSTVSFGSTNFTSQGGDDVCVARIGFGFAKPDLDCNGQLFWSGIKPGTTVNGSFQVMNIGDPNSHLNWIIAAYPSWGTWTFTPASVVNLAPEDGAITVNVTVTAPDAKNQEFQGQVTIVNTENASDFCVIPVYLHTPLSQGLHDQPFLTKLFEFFPHAFPILRHLMGY
jgi:hypothetical protein